VIFRSDIPWWHCILESFRLRQIDAPPSTKTQCYARKTQTSRPRKKPCSKHLKAAHERYATTLEAIGCICKALIARKLENCCSSIRNRTKRSDGHAALRGRSSGSRGRGATSTGCRKNTFSSGVEGEVKSETCGTKTCSCDKRTDCYAENRDTCGKRTCCDGDKGGICGEKTDTCGTMKGSTSSPSVTQAARMQKPCCSKKSDVCKEIASCDASVSCSQDACCNKFQPREKGAEPKPTSASGFHDIEKGTAIFEHVMLNVEGLTCVGCEKKLFRSLDAISGIHNLQTSLVLSHAEFDIDAWAGSADEVIREVTKATEFRCQRVNTKGPESQH